MNDIYLKPNLNADGSEKVNYDNPELPVYIRKGKLSFYRGYTFESHWHTDIELIVILRGHMAYNVNGELLSLGEGEGLFVNSGHMHFGYSNDTTDCTYLCLLVHPVLFCQNSYIERTFISPVINDTSHPYLLLRPSDPDAASVLRSVSHIFEQKQAGNPDYSLNIQSNLFEIMSALFALIKSTPEVALPQRDFNRIKAMLDFIAKHYQEKISLREISESAGISRNTCCSVFRQFVSCTPFEYLIKYRIEKGMELLAATDRTITEIAYAVGFSGSSYFTETFVRLVGVTPSQYKKSIPN